MRQPKGQGRFCAPASWRSLRALAEVQRTISTKSIEINDLGAPPALIEACGLRQGRLLQDLRACRARRLQRSAKGAGLFVGTIFAAFVSCLARARREGERAVDDANDI